jgi:hypothetical protein
VKEMYNSARGEEEALREEVEALRAELAAVAVARDELTQQARQLQERLALPMSSALRCVCAQSAGPSV